MMVSVPYPFIKKKKQKKNKKTEIRLRFFEKEQMMERNESGFCSLSVWQLW